MTQYEVNQWVWLFNPIRKKGRSPKLQIGWEEKPHRILQVINDVLVRIRKQGGHKTRVVHVNRIRKVKDLTKLDLEDSRTIGGEESVNPAEATVMQGRGARKRSSKDFWRQKREEEEQEDREERCYVTRRTYGRYGLLNVELHVNLNRQRLTVKRDTQQEMRRMKETEKKRYSRREGKIERTKVATQGYKDRLLMRTMVRAQELPNMISQEEALLMHVEQREQDLWEQQLELKARTQEFGDVKNAWNQQVQARLEELKEREKQIHEDIGEYVDPFE